MFRLISLVVLHGYETRTMLDQAFGLFGGVQELDAQQNSESSIHEGSQTRKVERDLASVRCDRE